MNTSSISVQRSAGGWLALYSPCRTTRQIHVTDARGEPVRYPSKDKAKIAAYERLLAEENRIEAMRFEPGQVQPMPKFYEPRSMAGKKAFAARRLEQALKEIAGT